MRNYILECCVDSVESAIAAEKGGASRLELCSGLLIGGLTPTAALLKQIRSVCKIPIRVLIRPRFGDFCYTDYEKEVYLEEIRQFAKLQADGIVIGALMPDGTLDIEFTKKAMEAAAGVPVALHRAFDMCSNPYQVLETAKELGICTILTSGQQDNCVEGISCLKQLSELSQGQIEILAGGGVKAENIAVLYENTKITSYHMSGKQIIESSMEYRNPQVHMGAASFSEFEIIRTEARQIEEAVKVLQNL